jgi:hypothetical protein
VQHVAERLPHESVEIGREGPVGTGELAEIHQEVRTLFVSRDVVAAVVARSPLELPEIPLAWAVVRREKGDDPVRLFRFDFGLRLRLRLRRERRHRRDPRSLGLSCLLPLRLGLRAGFRLACLDR